VNFRNIPNLPNLYTIRRVTEGGSVDPPDPPETIENPILGPLVEGDRLGDHVTWGSDV
jgi:hypothetical protein